MVRDVAGSHRSSLVVAAVAMAVAGVFRAVIVDPAGQDRVNFRMSQEVPASPGPAVLRLLAMEHASGVADVLWLQIVQDLGEQAAAREAKWDRVERLSATVTDLDPKYFSAYYASAIQLSAWARRANASDKILLKGQSNLPDRFEFPMLLGYNAYFIHGDAALASDYWLAASQLPDAPKFLPSLAARARFHAGDELGAIEVLETMISELDGIAREDAEIRLKALKTEFRLRLYDRACLQFRQERGRVPADGAELYREGYASEPPISYADEPIRIDEHCRARTDLNNIREDEAAARVGSAREQP